MANDEKIRNIWVLGLQYLIDINAKKQQRHIIRDNQ
jgi:hypothetical protein